MGTDVWAPKKNVVVTSRKGARSDVMCHMGFDCHMHAAAKWNRSAGKDPSIFAIVLETLAINLRCQGLWGHGSDGTASSDPGLIHSWT